jgi:hypothetical protein
MVTNTLNTNELLKTLIKNNYILSELILEIGN